MNNYIYGYIYLIFDQKTKKIYIGQKTGRSQDSVNYYGSGVLIKRIIKKRGTYFLKKRILGICFSKEMLNISETECISFFKAYDPIYGLNILKNGGNNTSGYSCLKRWKEQYGEQEALVKWNIKCKKHSDFLKGRYTKEKNPMFTRSYKDIWKEKYSEEEYNQKINKFNTDIKNRIKGRTLSEHTKLKISNTKKKEKYKRIDDVNTIIDDYIIFNLRSNDILQKYNITYHILYNILIENNIPIRKRGWKPKGYVPWNKKLKIEGDIK